MNRKKRGIVKEFTRKRIIGDYGSAALDLFGAIPFVGEDADTARLAKAGINIADVAKDADNIAYAVKTTNKAGDTLKNLNSTVLYPTHRLTISKKEFDKLVEDIKNNGILEAIKYVEHNGKKYVVDGHHRLYIARLLGLDNIPIERVGLPYKGYNSINSLFWE